MDNYINQLAEELEQQLKDKIFKHETDVVNSQQYQQELKYLSNFSLDAIQTIRTISIYSTRAKEIYDQFLTVRSSDNLIQSIVGLRDLVLSGIHNTAKREIRYMLEMTVKYLVVDQEKMDKSLPEKIQHLADNIPSSSIEIIDSLSTPFTIAIDKQFKDEVKDMFYKACAYVHPSKRQIDEQVDNYSKGIHIGFETAKMLADINKLLFRAYDIILTMLFIGFGQSMSGDLFIEIYDIEPKWKFHKGKYLKEYSRLFDYKVERQKNNR